MVPPQSVTFDSAWLATIENNEVVTQEITDNTCTKLRNKELGPNAGGTCEEPPVCLHTRGLLARGP